MEKHKYAILANKEEVNNWQLEFETSEIKQMADFIDNLSSITSELHNLSQINS